MQTIALVGNPNTGKTTLFNNITKQNEHVGNWHGVTVEHKQKNIIFDGETLSIVDLPGVYSLNSYSFEEEVTNNFLKNNNCLILNVCDANNIKRNLYLTLSLIASGFKPVLVVNMANELKKTGTVINTSKLEKILGTKVFLINANSKKEVKNLLTNIIKINSEDSFQPSEFIQEFKNKQKRLKNNNIEEVAKQRYEVINKITSECITKNTNKIYGFSKLDKIFLNKYFALPIFLCIIAIIFYLTFNSFGKFLSDLLGSFSSAFICEPLLKLLNSISASEFVLKLIEEGILGGILSVINFLPQVVLLFVCLNILEATGYLSRLAFTLEDIFSKVGLSGKSVFALLMGFGCSTTASLTARGMEDKNSKIKTAMLTPYISCSAKLPLYLVVCGAYFENKSFLIIFLLYILGVITSLIVSYVLEKTILPSKTKSFIMEFPALRLPKFSHLLKLALIDAKNFLIRVGTVILSFSCIIWIAQNCNFALKYIAHSNQKSILETVGEFLSFIFKPLGFGNYGAVCALICGVVAKEIIVSSLKIINNLSDSDSLTSLSKSLTHKSSAVYFTKASSLSFLTFSSMYLPCISTMGVLKKEIGLKWTLFACLLEFSISYLLSFIVYKILLVYYNLGLIACLLSMFAFGVFLISFIFIIKFFKSKNKCKYCKNFKCCKGECK